MEYGHVFSDEACLDEALFVFMRGPRSFTGEDVAEIHGHGGAANLAALLRCVIAAGARHAEAGEFTRRAFENHRIDLTRAEAIADIVNASSQRALRIAQDQLSGKLGDALQKHIAAVTNLRAEIEAGIDFPEELLGEEKRKRQSEDANNAARQCEDLANSYGLGKALHDGIDVVLRGSVNVGKSSLFNSLIGKERSIVTEEPGTTRDYVEADVVWDGISITLVDTAGLRSKSQVDAIEEKGIDMGKARAARADIEVLVVEEDEQVDAIDELRTLVVRSKCDLIENLDTTSDTTKSATIFTSALTGEGISALKRAIVNRATRGAAESAEGCVITNERQRTRLAAAATSLYSAGQLIEQNAPAEIVVLELRDARNVLAAITGEEVGDEMLDALFSNFCIGK